MDLPQSGDYEKDLLAWVASQVNESESFLKSQYGYSEIEKSIAYIQGDQDSGHRVDRTEDLSNLSFNHMGKIATDIVAALTDIKPFFSYRTNNDLFSHQAQIFNKLAHSWWVNNFIDLKLGGGVQLAVPAGTSYLQLVLNSSLHGGLGDLDLIPRDCRDVLPIRPSTSISIQDSMGVIIRSVETIFDLRRKYPSKAEHLVPDRDIGYHSPNVSRHSVGQRIMSPAVALLKKKKAKAGGEVPGKTIYTIYLKDDTENKGSTPRRMGYGPNDEEYTWSYTVQKGEKLYPRGRVIVCGDDIVLYDGPNIYWHGQFPLVKLPMDLSFVYPNSFLSKSLTKDLIPHQDMINKIGRGYDDAIAKVLRPNVRADSRAISHEKLRRFDPRRSGQKLMMNPSAGEGIVYEPPPELPDYVFKFFEMLPSVMENLAGSVDLTSLAKAKQLPSAETVDAIMQAMTPTTRLRGRLMEATLRELAEQLKVNFLQFYNAPRRIAILGQDGLTFEDYDFDPGTLIPDSSGHFKGSQTRLEGVEGLTKSDRAIKHSHNFSFYVTPNSMLELALVTKKLLYLQLRRMNEIDHQTFLEMLEIPNIEKINERLGSEIDQKIQMVQQATAGTAGRRPTAQVAPHMEQKGDGRPVVSET